MAVNRAPLIAQLARARGLDPQAVLSIAGVESPSGRPGDHNTSFGPFQLHAGGALPASIWSRGPAFANAWANSTQGISYALDGMAKVAGGLHGGAAIQALVSRFERPANVGAEIQRAAGLYGGNVQIGSGGFTASGAQPMATDAFRSMIASQLLSGGTGSDNGLDILSLAFARQALGAAQQTYGAQPSAGSTLTQGSGTVPMLNVTGSAMGLNPHFWQTVNAAARAAGATQIKITSGYRSAKQNAAAGGVGNSNHLTGNAVDGYGLIPGRGWVPLGTLLKTSASRFGLRSGDQPGFFNGGTDPVHVDDAANLQA